MPHSKQGRAEAAIANAVPRLGAALAMLAATAVLTGWALDIPRLKSLSVGWVTVKANTALCAFLTGASLWLLAREGVRARRAQLGRALAAAVALIAALTLAQDLWVLDFGIDQALFREDVDAVQTPNPGRMSPVSASGFLLLGLALLGLDRKGRNGGHPAQALVVLPAFLGLAAVCGYLFEAGTMVAETRVTGMNVGAALLLLSLALGILCARTSDRPLNLLTQSGLGSLMARRLLPVAALATLILAWLREYSESLHLYSAADGAALFATANILVLSAFIWSTARSTNQADRGRRQAEAETLRLLAELDQRVAERTARLEAVNHELEAFSYAVSHDLRAPLRAIDGFSQALQEDYAERFDETGQDYLRRVRAGAQRMGRLIDDLLELSRVTRTQMTLEPVDVSALARQTIADLTHQQAERNVEWVIQDPLVARADPRLLRIALDNLLGNALKFTGKVERARIEIGRQDEGEGAAFFVRDNGAGFSMEHAGRLFSAFQRLHRADDFPGTGVGLATVQRIVSRHGGRIHAESKPDKGATFFFTLPDH